MTTRRNSPVLALFTEVSARLLDILGDEDFAVEMKLQERGSLITLKVGEEGDELSLDLGR